MDCGKVVQKLVFLSKKAVSYSSSSIMKCPGLLKAKLPPKFSAIPPTRKDEALSRRLKNPGQHGSCRRLAMFPPRRSAGESVKRGRRISGMERKKSAHPERIPAQDCRAIALPTITMSGRGFRLASEYGCMIDMPMDAAVGHRGMSPISEPVTLNPR